MCQNKDFENCCGNSYKTNSCSGPYGSQKTNSCSGPCCPCCPYSSQKTNSCYGPCCPCCPCCGPYGSQKTNSCCGPYGSQKTNSCCGPCSCNQTMGQNRIVIIKHVHYHYYNDDSCEEDDDCENNLDCCRNQNKTDEPKTGIKIDPADINQK